MAVNKNLHTLYIIMCVISKIPESIGVLTNLTQLVIGSCPITDLPPLIEALTTLHTIMLFTHNDEPPINSRAFKTLEIIIDLPIGFPINNIISLIPDTGTRTASFSWTGEDASDIASGTRNIGDWTLTQGMAPPQADFQYVPTHKRTRITVGGNIQLES